MTEIPAPFTVAVPDAELEALRTRLRLTRWPEAETAAGWIQGAPLAETRALADYWANEYDWRRCEAALNQWPQYSVEIDGLTIYFLHVRSAHSQAVPLLLTHGWPGSVLEFLDTIPLLTDPTRHGGTAADAFHVVIPSLPGYGFSGKPEQTGWGVGRIAQAWGKLMAMLGYDDWFAQGGDWGSLVTTAIAADRVPGCRGIHVNMISMKAEPKDPANPTLAERRALDAAARYQREDLGYVSQQKTKPQTIGYGLVDSPVALLAWIFEKMQSWTDNRGDLFSCLSRDRILDNVTLYWLTASGASAARLYWESAGRVGEDPIDLPSAVSMFPGELIPVPREWLGRYCKLVYFNEPDKGGHFAAWEQPEIFVAELRAAFALMR
ncbi:epoxide hydrolase family protein [Bradyrhizobium liaoningense]